MLLRFVGPLPAGRGGRCGGGVEGAREASKEEGVAAGVLAVRVERGGGERAHGDSKHRGAEQDGWGRRPKGERL